MCLKIQFDLKKKKTRKKRIQGDMWQKVLHALEIYSVLMQGFLPALPIFIYKLTILYRD